MQEEAEDKGKKLRRLQRKHVDLEAQLEALYSEQQVSGE